MAIGPKALNDKISPMVNQTADAWEKEIDTLLRDGRHEIEGGHYCVYLDELRQEKRITAHESRVIIEISRRYKAAGWGSISLYPSGAKGERLIFKV